MKFPNASKVDGGVRFVQFGFEFGSFDGIFLEGESSVNCVTSVKEFSVAFIFVRFGVVHGTVGDASGSDAKGCYK